MSGLKNIDKVHFIGIGGAGMSGLAKVLSEKGINVSGSDIKASSNTRNLEKLGVTIKIGHSKSNIDDEQVVVISSAIKADNIELKEAKRQNKKIYQRAQMLALIAENKKVIAVSGTHGKTTTTSMISAVFEHNNLDPTFLVGGELNDIGANAKYGQGSYFIAETDESDGSLLNFDPDLLVITNIEPDHLDFFESFAKIKELFIIFVKKIRPGGKVICFGDHPHVKEIIPFAEQEVITYGKMPENDYYYDDFNQKDYGSSFKIYKKREALGMVNLPVPGEHNVLNTLAATVLSFEVGLSFEEIRDALKNFCGVKRRFQFIGKTKKAFVYDDYAHHPTEVAATLKATANEKNGRLVCVFQPHRYSRTNFLADDFGNAFRDADLVIITDVYGAGEDPIPGVSGKLIVDAICDNLETKDVVYLPYLSDIIAFLEKEIRPKDTIITMGAGDISSVGKKLVSIA